ncbi:hypothetical protein JHK87_047995 [Glycine soja]|nr:hypothetical protein JHK87_047995 [Glycine soja]
MSIYHFPHHGRVPRLPPHIPRPPLFSLLTFHGDSLVQSNADHDLLTAFEIDDAELLYEIRLLSALQRVAATSFVVENRCDGKATQELAHAMKAFPNKGWESFDYTLPEDCLSFVYYRQSREHRNPSEQRIRHWSRRWAWRRRRRRRM